MPLKFPETREFLDLIELLIGERPVFRKGERWDLAHPGQGCFITFLQRKDKHVEGAIVTDLPATLYMGGKLILLPENTLQEMSVLGQSDQQVIEAVNEVVNNLRTLFNNIPKNPHVAPTDTFAYQVPGADDYVGWILDPSDRIDYVGETICGRGTITMLTK